MNYEGRWYLCLSQTFICTLQLKDEDIVIAKLNATANDISSSYM